MNPADHIDAFKVLGIVMITVGVGLLVSIVPLFGKKSECDCDE
jgi:hypothetical protein